MLQERNTGAVVLQSNETTETEQNEFSETKSEICVLQIKNTNVTMYCNNNDKINRENHISVM